MLIAKWILAGLHDDIKKLRKKLEVMPTFHQIIYVWTCIWSKVQFCSRDKKWLIFFYYTHVSFEAFLFIHLCH